MRAWAFLATLVLVVLAFATPVAAQTEGLEYSEDVTYTVLEDSVRVDLDATMTNTTVERRQGDTVFFSFFDTLVFIAPSGLTDLTITSAGSQLLSTAEAIDDDFDVVTAVLPERLSSGESRDFDVSYTLPRGEFRSDGAFISNPAHHGFPLWSFSDPGTGSLTLRVPEDAEVSELGETIEPGSAEDGFITWVPRNFDVPEEFFTYVNVVRDSRLEERNFEVADQDISLRSWPGDTEWADFAQDAIEDGIPALEELIGTPIPEQDTLEVTASVTPLLFGFAGWYDPADTSIEIGNELDRGVMLHELSHAWFNDSLFADRWVLEGLAEEYSWQIDRQLGAPDEELPSTPRSTDAGAVRLNDWSDAILGLGNADLRERELYGYNASWFVVREIADIVGNDGLQQMILAADSDTPAYSGARSLLLNDWRRLLDLAALQTDAAGEAGLEDLFVEFVVGDADAQLLAERSQARLQYRRFTDRPLQWRVPADIDQAMADWRFEDAQVLLREANSVLDLQRRVLHQADLAGLEADEAGRSAYEQDDPDFALAFAVLAEQEAAIGSVVDVRELATAPLTRQEQLGLDGLDLAAITAQAEQAYAQNRFGDVVTLRDELAGVRAEAAQVGASRLLWSRFALGAAVALALLGIIKMVHGRPWKDSEAAAA